MSAVGYMKRKRIAARKAGKCGMCCSRKVPPNMKTCDHCRDLGRARDRKAKSPFCVKCFSFHAASGPHKREPMLFRGAV